MKNLFIFFMTVLYCAPSFTYAQEHPDFTLTHQVKTTTVKDQQRAGTCWGYATLSFLETEALRMGYGNFDLSEQYIVHYAYQTKASDYVRFHGKANFSQGGQAHDVLNVMRKHGIVPEADYKGLEYGTNFHNHGEMAAVLQGMLEGVLKNANRKHTPVWRDAVRAVLNVYLGKVPEKIEYEGKPYTPESFASDVLRIKPDDYVELTSFSHHPYYTAFDLEVPDNWSHDLYYNLPASELMEVMQHALQNGYSIDWDGDVSEEDFDHEAGAATLALDDKVALKANPQSYRQETFNNFTTTDDHLMHLTALAEDQAGNVYFQTKNSWGPGSNDYGGYLYMSEDYVMLKTIAIMVHKDAIPKSIAKKLF